VALRRRLAERRKALGYSQEALAEKLGIDRTTVSRWERGHTDPYPHIRPDLCQVLKVTAGELHALLEPGPEVIPHSLHAAPALTVRVLSEPDLTGELDDMYRRELLRLLSVGGALIALPLVTPTAEPGLAAPSKDAADPGQYAQLNARLWQVFALARSKRLVYPLVHDQLSLLTGQMQQARSVQGRRQLCVLACELFQLAGEICFDSNQYTDAVRCYTLAAEAGREARSYDRWACALTRQAFVSIYEQQYAQASSILSAAARVAQHGDSQLSTRHWIAAVQAQSHAGRGDLDSSERALDTAGNVLDLTGPVHPGGWLRFDGSHLAEERGTCYLAVGRADLAETALTEALGQSVSLRRRGSLLTDLALAGVQRRDLDQLLLYGHDAIDLAEQTQSSGYVGRKLQILKVKLEPFTADNRVAQLTDRIANLPDTA
jgi:transcriptional regulator with XRE-family HTH domain